MDLVALADSPYLRVRTLLLFEQHAAGLEVADLGHHAALHNRAALVILDISHPTRLFECDLFRKALLFEVADGVVVGIGEEVHDARGGLDVVFQVRHEMGAVALDLLVGGDGAEDDLGELTLVKGAVCDATVVVSECVCLQLEKLLTLQPRVDA